jgi:hypothetical protein
MSAAPFISAPVQAELPDWILALKPSDEELAAAESAEGAAFVGLDAELEALAQTNPDDIAWLAQVADQPLPPVSSLEADSILEGHLPATLTLPPRPAPRRRASRLRQNERLIIILMLFMVILEFLIGALLLRLNLAR